MMRVNTLLIYISLYVLVATGQVHGMEDKLRWGGFAGQGFVYTNDNNLYGDSDDGVSTEFDEFGLWGAYSFKSGFTLTGQASMRDAGSLENGSLNLDYAFASMLFIQTMDHVVGARVGRIRAAFGLYNDIRDAPHTRPSIMMPQSIYPERLRETLFSSDGVEVYGSWQFGLDQFSYQLFLGRSIIEDDEIDEASGVDVGDTGDLGLDAIGGDPQGDETYIARMIYELDAGTWRFALTYSRPKFHYENEFDTIIFDGVPFVMKEGSIRRRVIISSIEYNQLDWTFTAEYLRDKRRTNGVFVGFDTGNVHGESYYTQIVKRFGASWDIVIRYDVEGTNRRDKSNPLTNTKDLTLGVGYRPTSNWLVRAEIHSVKGTGWLSNLDNPIGERKEHWNAFLLQISYHM